MGNGLMEGKLGSTRGEHEHPKLLSPALPSTAVSQQVKATRQTWCICKRSGVLGGGWVAYVREAEAHGSPWPPASPQAL